MQLKEVSFELALKLKEVGFDYHTNMYYHVKLKELKSNPKGLNYYKDWNLSFIKDEDKEKLFKIVPNVSAPTLEHAKMWFLNVHDIYINVHRYYKKGYPLWEFHVQLSGGKDTNYNSPYNTPEEALEAGLLEAYELIKNK